MPKKKKTSLPILPSFLLVFLGSTLLAGALFLFFELQYEGRVYPNVSVGDIPFRGQTSQDVKAYWEKQNAPFQGKSFEFRLGNDVATVSAEELGLGFDATLSATQAIAAGRSGHWMSDLRTKFFQKTNLTPFLRWNTQTIDDALATVSERINIPVENALFRFVYGKVVAFRPSHDGRRVNIEKAKRDFSTVVSTIKNDAPNTIVIPLTIAIIPPAITTNQANLFGIKERIGVGYSEFSGSIAGRIHNVALAASRLNGILIKPGEVLSFNDTIGDISAATGYQSAYIIKEGRTVLGDGGGVCQVSSTLFRAALNAGLPIVERRAHAYRVHYYEEGGFKPGLDATVFAPTVDLKIKNNTPGFILIQTKADLGRPSLTFELFGTTDGRTAQILNHRVWDETPPPPPRYQDDPSLPKGAIKQVDFAAWGTKASFQYKVIRGNETLEDTSFASTFRPWQAVYLRGTL